MNTRSSREKHPVLPWRAAEQLFSVPKNLGFKENEVKESLRSFNYLSALILNSSNVGPGLSQRVFPAYLGVSILPNPIIPFQCKKTNYTCMRIQVLITTVILIRFSTSYPSFSSQNYFWMQKLEFRSSFCPTRLTGDHQQLCDMNAKHAGCM